MKRKFYDCPLGTRFHYIPEISGHKNTYVILSHYGDNGCGLVAKWSGEDGAVHTQGVYSAAETPKECAGLHINTIPWTQLSDKTREL